jgi:hydrogenase/urease accessory protein HupE
MTKLAATALLAAALALPSSAQPHELRPALLELRQTGPTEHDVTWRVPARGDMRLRLDVELPPGCGDVGPRRRRIVDTISVEEWRTRCPDGLGGREITVAGLERTLTDVIVRVVHADGTVQTRRLVPAAPRFTAEAAPSGLEVARAYLGLGFTHILLGVDHLLFLLALLILVRGGQRIVLTVTAFTLAHSITLAAATLGFVRVPGPPVEATIALSIAFVAREIVMGYRGRPGLTERRPWLVAFAFGLLHGLGFAGALSEVGLPASAIPGALLFFNVGVEAGQLLFVAAVLAAVAAGRRWVPAPLAGWRWVPPYAIGGVACWWVIARVAAFWT